MKRFFLPILMFCLVSLNTLADEGETQEMYAAAPDITLTIE